MSKDNTTPKEVQQKVFEKIVKKGKKQIEKRGKILERLEIQYMPITDIKPNEYNPNRQNEHDFELLVKSMEEDGFTQPIICLPDRTIVDGEHRWRAAETLGFTEIPVVIVEMTPEQMRIATLRHNRARGSEDVDLTTEVLRDLEELGALNWAQDSLMLDDLEITRLLEDIKVTDELAADEFSQAWEPVERDLDDDHDTTEARIVKTSSGQEITTALSRRALSDKRVREKLIKEAKTDEEREMRQKDTNFYHLSLMFSGEEAKIVKKTLGSEPAEKIVQMCKKES